MYSLGIDIGSTTLKMSLLDDNGLTPSRLNDMIIYHRHNANPAQIGTQMLSDLLSRMGDVDIKVCMTGSVGMGYAERCGIAFEQEVIASVAVIRTLYPQVKTLIDMGGEDCKIIFFETDRAPIMRMNGNCAGGTGSFIDQTAILLGVDINELDTLAANYKQIYPIASRCGVFSKTDIQNLLSQNVSKSDIAASVFHAVSIQLVSSLTRGLEVRSKVFLSGGPFAYFSQLKRHITNVLQLMEADIVMSDHPELIPATGCALLAKKVMKLSKLISQFKQAEKVPYQTSSNLKPLFLTQKEYENWLQTKQTNNFTLASFQPTNNPTLYMGVDSGSTTTKLVLLDDQCRILYRDYTFNHGDSYSAFKNCLSRMAEKLQLPADVTIVSASTGYGESLLKTAFSLQFGVVETIAHFIAAHYVEPQVSFILDIGGQDMKAIFIENDSIQRVEINEACSSGCGSFLMTFASQCEQSLENFATLALYAPHPYDLGTRCTVFMNSKVKQAMREGATIGDIAAGLSYSVIKNCLYKVLKLHSVSELGEKIVVQGGTFKNHSIVRALEVLTGATVSFSNTPELMGAIGAAMYARTEHKRTRTPHEHQ